MRLFPGLFLALSAQALLVAALPGGLLVWNMHNGFETELKRRDRDQLEALAATLGEAARGGRPLAQVLAENDRRDPQRLGGRVALVDPEGRPIAGPAGPTRIERPVQVDGRTVAVARVVREPRITDEDRQFLFNQYLGVAVIIAGTFVLLLLAAFEIARRWTAPQRALHALSRAVVQGDHEIEFEERGAVETAATMRNLGRIARQFSRIESARRTWLASIADELKQPTESLARHLEELADTDPNLDAELAEGLIEDQRRLSQMSEDLSAVALADLGRLPVTFTQVDPRALIHNAIWAHAKRAKSLGVSLETSGLPNYTILVKWDGERIDQLFGALIENSLRYTPKGGRIVLGLESSRDAWRLVIDDSAPGVDVMLSQRLFEPFYRSADNAVGNQGASGLGLATARAIVEAHHGRIEAGRSPIGGLRVVVVMPGSPPTA